MALKIRLASEQDHPQLLEFYESSPIEGTRLAFQSKRSPDFFKLLRYQSEESFVWLAEQGSQLSGLGSLSARMGYINGKLERVGYLGDFRVAFNRALIRSWRDQYAEILKGRPERHFLTAVIDQNLKAHRAFVDQKKSNFHYHKLTSYWMINFFGRLPRFSLPLKNFDMQIRNATREDQMALTGFLDRQNQAKAFGFCFDQNQNLNELERRLKTWDGLQWESFILAHRNGKLVGSAALWSPFEAKRHVLVRLPAELKFLLKLTKGISPGTPVRAQYLTHLEIDRELTSDSRARIFLGLLDAAYTQYKQTNAHLLSFCDFESNRWHHRLKGYLFQKIPMSLYSVSHRENSVPPLSIESCKELGFEIALA